MSEENKKNNGEKIDRRKFNKGRFKKTEEDRLKEQQEIEKLLNKKNEQTTQPPQEQKTQTTPPIQEPTDDIPIMEYNENKTTEEQTNNTSSGNDNVIIDKSKLSTEVHNPDATPIDNPVDEKPYANPLKGQGDANTPIPEPEFKAPDMNSLFGAPKQPEADKKQETAKAQGTPMAEKSGLTEALKNDDLRTPTEKNEGAIMAVDAVLEGYSELHKVGRWLGQVNMDKLNDKFIDEKLDPNVTIPVTETKTVTLREFVEKYNTEVDKAITLDPEFVAKVRPVMIRVFEKNGWGMSDEMFLMLMFGKDLAEKSIMVFSMKRSINGVIANLEKQFAREKQMIEEAHLHAQQPTKQQPVPPQHQPPVQFKKEEEMEVITPTEEFTKAPVSENKLSSLVVSDDADPEMSKQ